MPKHSAEELAALPSEALIQLVLELERRNEELEALAAGRQAEKAPPPAPDAPAPPSLLLGLLEDTEAGAGPPQKPAPDVPGPARPQLERGISRIPANVEVADRLRKELAQAVEGIVLGRQSSTPDGGEIGKAWSRLTNANFFLPDFEAEEPGLAEYVEAKLMARDHQDGLEESLALNWALKDLGEEHRLRVLRTAADGNCLLHGTLLAMIGLHDATQVGTSGLSSLRAAMSRMFQEPKFADPIRKRWVRQIARDSAWQPESQQDNPPRQVEVSEEQLNREWAEMVEIASRPNAFLDSVHVLAMAHALRRPIVVLARATQTDPFGSPLTPVFFHGIYLPLERPPQQCCRQPLLLCFQDAHFMPVVPFAASSSRCAHVRVPLADGRGEELPLRFALESELELRWELVEKYLDLQRDVSLPLADVKCNVALLSRNSEHALVKEMAGHLVELCAGRFRAERTEAERKRKAEADGSVAPPKRQKAAGDVALDLSQQSQDRQLESEEEEELDASVEDKFEVRLPRGSRPGDRTFYVMPQGCTDKERVDFVVPAGCYEGDLVLLTARFAVKGHCIRSLREVTQCPRERAVELLAKTHGNVERAAQRYFDDGLDD